jgi:multicomponent Na+:H+ antiporter subunit D
MLAVPAVLLALALAAALIPGMVPGFERAAALFTDHGGYAHWVLQGAHVPLPHLPPSHISADDVLYGSLSIAGAVAAAAVGLFGRPLREGLPARVRDPALSTMHGLRGLHSGHIGDYIAWWTAGAGVLGAACLLAL